MFFFSFSLFSLDTHTHTQTHTPSLLGALEGGSTVLNKIFPKALIRKTMVLVNSALHLPFPPPTRKKKHKTKTASKCRGAEGLLFQ